MSASRVALLILALNGALARAQAASTFAGQWAMEDVIRERWMHRRNEPRFTPFSDTHSWVFADSTRDAPGGRRLFLTFGRNAYGRDSAVLETDRGGHVAFLSAGYAPFARRGAIYPGDSARYVEWKRHPLEGTVTLAATRIWDMIPTFPSGLPRVSMTWSDTIARLATDEGFRQSLRGVRRSRITGDTSIDGRHLWIVRDSAAVVYDEQYPERERTLDTTVIVHRNASGFTRGTHYFDPALRVFRSRADSTWLSGTATLEYLDGRTFRTPARYERTRAWKLYDPAGYARRLADDRSARIRDAGGMVIVPGTELQRRLSSGDTRARDSLIHRWQQSRDPNEADDLFRMLSTWTVRDPRVSMRLDDMRVAAGDSAFYYALLARRAYGTLQPPDTADMHGMITFMRDPSLMWDLNASRDWLYENLAQGLTTAPPAVVGKSPRAACTPAACQMLAAEWTTSREPRLRDLALIAHAAMAPRPWADTVIALDGPQHPLLHDAAMLANGVGATWPASAKRHLPGPEGDWHEWLAWMNGATGRNDTMAAGVRFEDSHVVALRYYMARTGRDVIGELKRDLEHASSDSARLVFGTMLHGLGQLSMSESEIADAFISGVPSRIDLARQALASHFDRSTQRMEDAAAIPLTNRVIAACVDTVRLWRRLPAEESAPGGGPATLHRRAERHVLASDDLPAAVVAQWTGRVEMMTRALWSSQDERVGGVLCSVAPVRRWGRFAMIEVNVSERITRAAGQSPMVNASGATYVLMERNGEWIIVDEGRWVT